MELSNLGKFIYVFDVNARDRLIAEKYHLLKSDERQNIYIFENKDCFAYSELEFSFALSDILTF